MGHPHHSEGFHKSKKSNSLSIRLTESAVFLPTDNTPLRRNTRIPDSRNATLRGLLILDLVKPTKISKIDIELFATTSTAWPEGIGARRIDVTEDHRVFYASTVYFNGGKKPSRRTASIGPGVSYSNYRHYGDFDEDIPAEGDGEFEEDWDDNDMAPLPDTNQPRLTLNTTNNPNPTIPETESRTGDFSDSRLVYPNETVRPQSVHREDTTSSNSTGRSHYSFPYINSSRFAHRRLSADVSQYHAMPISSTTHESTASGQGTQADLEQLAPIPPYSPYPASTHELVGVPDTPASPAGPAGPAQSLEEFRNSLQSNLRSSQVFSSESGSPASGSALSLQSGQQHDQSLSRHTSTHGAIPESLENEETASRRSWMSHSQRHRSASSSRTRPDRYQSQPRSPLPPIQAQGAPPPDPHSSAPSPNGTDRERGRRRFSFTHLFMRSPSPRTSGFGLSLERASHNRESSVDVEPSPSRSARRRGRTVERQPERLYQPMDFPEEAARARESKERGRTGTSSVILRLLKEKDRDKDDWKEFKPGTYTYPISFSIPSDAPPSIQCDYGSVVWRLSANAHRPGTFKTKLTAVRDVITISCPTEEDTEDTENIIVERQWDQELQYLISVSGRSFYIGGTMPVTITLMPLTKMKVHRLSVYIEERVDYYTNMRRLARSDPITNFCLLSIKGKGKGAGPILPLDSDSSDALRDSPLFALLDPNLSENQLSETTSNLMGPGPWTFHQDLPLPKSCDDMHFTNRNRRSNIIVSHMLKVIMRVERGDDVQIDMKTGKRKLFDIVVQTPVLILSCRCNPEWTSLPRYAEAFDDSALIVPSCPCQVERNRLATEAASHAHRSSVTAALERITSRHSTDSSDASAAETSPVHPRSSLSMRHLGHNESILRSTYLFERLVSGQESESGEAPPAYVDNAPNSLMALARPPVSPVHVNGVTAMS
ncbi:hypothetical protein BDN70DRAFT_916541 [Pholiota conissans]|uniref:Arrestin C-terminal-like domain-containing protein n=1 Tax=Pholiota conissans TaxID=109636 RepID=A0A9P5ZHL5_9AGAR|nr:hypothetical protein BDN70DRAFT_916541 [Pholiota conissans]